MVRHGVETGYTTCLQRVNRGAACIFEMEDIMKQSRSEKEVSCMGCPIRMGDSTATVRRLLVSTHGAPPPRSAQEQG